MSVNKQAEENDVLEQENDEMDAVKGSGPTVTLDHALELAQSHHQAGNYVVADQTYRDILRSVPDHYPTVYYMAVLCFQRGMKKEALEFSAKAVAHDPDNANCWVNNGCILATNEKYEEALDSFDEAISIEPELYDAFANKSYALWSLERYEEAEETALQGILINDERIECYINQGISLAKMGKFDEANQVWEQASEVDPNNSVVYSNWSNSLRDMYLLTEAIAMAEKAIELNPKSFEGFCALGNALRDNGRFSEAIENYKNAIDIKPDYVKAHINMSITCGDARRFKEAVSAAKFAVSFAPDDAKAHFYLSQSHQAMGQYKEAHESADRAVNLEPDNALYLLNLAEILMSQDNSDDAKIIIDRAVAMQPKDPRTLLALAEVYQGLDDPGKAVEVLDQILKEHNANPSLWVRKARILEQATKIDEALEAIDHALAVNPEFSHALVGKAEILLTGNRKDEAHEYLQRAGALEEKDPGYYMLLPSFKKITPDDEEYKILLGYLKDGERYGLDTQSGLNFTLSSIHEKAGEYDKAFEYLKAGNEIRAKSRGVINPRIHDFATPMINTFPPELLKEYEGAGADSDVPVFIVGMPRSGTTLTEQIISSHPQVYGAGELYDLQTVMREKGPLSLNNADEMGEEYVRRVKARAGDGDYRHITDKMPGNYMRVGIIRCILPNAKIIHCRRHPMDNLLSCYKQNFAMGHEWTMHQSTLAEQYQLYRRLMDYWRDQLPEGVMLEIDYEDTVSDFENQARKLIDFIGLPWDDACLEPHKQKRAVLTASRNQVIRPVYTSSVEAWKRFEDQLQPLYNSLKDMGYVE